MNNKITFLILALFILALGSCGVIENLKEPEPNPEVRMSISYIGYTHVDFKVELTDFTDLSNFKEITIYYDKTNNITENSPSKTFYYDNETFNAALTGLEMGEGYFVKIIDYQASSTNNYVTTKIATFDCNISEGFIMGDNSITRQWETSGMFGGPTRMREINSGNGLTGNLEGQFERIRMEIPVPGNFYSGIYSTYNEISENGVKPSAGSASIVLTDANGITYSAVAAQAFQFTEENFGFHVTFCDMVFINDAGQTITLSANLEGI